MDFVEYEDMKEEFNKIFDFADYEYFYHMTESGNGEKICDNGLMMVDSDISKTLINITYEDSLDYDNFLSTGAGNVDFRKEMVIVKVPKEELDCLVNNNLIKNDSWTCVDDPNYVISSKNIAGYISLEDKCFYENYNSLYPLFEDGNFKIL